MGTLTELSAAVLAATMLLGGISANSAEPVKIRASWVVAPADWGPLLMEKPELMQNSGKSYVYEAVRFQRHARGDHRARQQRDRAGNLAFSSLALAIENAGLEDLRIVGDQFVDGSSGHYSNEYLVLTDGPIRKVEDLRGKVLATNTVGSGVDVAMRVMLRKHGLEDKRDYTVIEVPFPTMKAILMQKKVDLATAVAPFAFDPELKQVAHPLFAQRDALGPTQMLVWVARGPFLQKNRPAMVDFMQDAVRVVRWYLDPAHHAEAVQIAAKLTKQRPELFANWLFTNKDYSRSPDLLPDLAALQSNIDAQRDLGFLKGPIDVQKYADLSLVREAAARLK